MCPYTVHGAARPRAAVHSIRAHGATSRYALLWPQDTVHTLVELLVGLLVRDALWRRLLADPRGGVDQQLYTFDINNILHAQYVTILTLLYIKP